MFMDENFDSTNYPEAFTKAKKVTSAAVMAVHDLFEHLKAHPETREIVSNVLNCWDKNDGTWSAMTYVLDVFDQFVIEEAADATASTRSDSPHPCSQR
jgi:hypothetical protein